MSAATLRFVENCGHYSVYLDGEDNEVYIGPGPENIRLRDLDEIGIDTLWSEWDSLPWAKKVALRNGFDFMDWAGRQIINPDSLDDYLMCEDCDDPVNRDDMTSVENDTKDVCSSCSESYHYCENCETYASSCNTTLEDESVCDSCYNDSYYYCDHCEGRYHSEHSEDHHHGGCDCEAPGQQFRMPDGNGGFLANDTSGNFTLAAGVISVEGMGLIRREILNTVYVMESEINSDVAYDDPIRLPTAQLRNVAYCVTEMDPTWQTKNGNFTKRLSSFAHKEWKVKVPADLLSRIGNIASAHSQAVDVKVEVTRDLNLPAEDFAHEDSCWWQSYASSRCALKNSGGFGVRSFNDRSWGDEVSGRVWVMPLKHGVRRDWSGREQKALVPTFNTETPDAWILFNAYGDLEGFKAPRLVAHMVGGTYRKVGFDADPMYINSNMGYLVGSESVLSEYPDSSLTVRVHEHGNLFQQEQEETKRAERAATEALLAPVNQEVAHV